MHQTLQRAYCSRKKAPCYNYITKTHLTEIKRKLDLDITALKPKGFSDQPNRVCQQRQYNIRRASKIRIIQVNRPIE